MNVKKTLGLVLLLLLADQTLKFYIKTHFLLGQEVSVLGNWFHLHFVENNGMAFGMEWGGTTGKLLLSIFRIVVITALGWYLFRVIHKREKTGYIISLALIFTGALGNLIDSAFYGMIFSESTFYQVAELFPEAGGYSRFLQGKVVDMLFFPLIDTNLPSWVPFYGDKHFLFFAPVFNIADSCISVGVFILLIFYRAFFRKN